ncbi:MAG: hypothetical protein M3Q46_15175 [Verrucomicrobiota bacterium]|nr:hypothetical protein [Verrucomicrobiota bacterium]
MPPSIRILALILQAVLLATNLTSCGEAGTSEDTVAAPLSPLEIQINSYEKTANEYIRLSKKHGTGDVSITVLLIQARKSFQDEGAELQKAVPQMTPQQAQRVAEITAETAPYLPK